MTEPRVRILDTTLRDGSHAIAHRLTPENVRHVAAALDAAGVWAIAVGHGDGLGARSLQYGFGLHSDEELIAAAAEVVNRAKIATVLLPGIGTRSDLESVNAVGARICRVSTLCTEVDIAPQHLRLARELGMEPQSHVTMAHLLGPREFAEAAKIVSDAGSECIYIVDTAGALMPDDVRARISAMRDVLLDEVALGMHAHNNLSLAVANSLAAVQEGATVVDATLAGLGAGAGNCQTEAIVAVLERLGIETDVDLWALQDVADDYVRGTVMTRPQEVDRLTLSLGYAGVPSSYLLHAERGGERFGVDARDILVELGRRKAVIGQEDMILEIGAELAARREGPARGTGSMTQRSVT